MHCLYANAVVQPSVQHYSCYMTWKTKVHTWCRYCHLCINAPMWREKRWLQGIFDPPSYVKCMKCIMLVQDVIVLFVFYQSDWCPPSLRQRGTTSSSLVSAHDSATAAGRNSRVVRLAHKSTGTAPKCTAIPTALVGCPEAWMEVVLNTPMNHVYKQCY